MTQQRRRYVQPSSEVVFGEEAKFRVATDTGNLLGNLNNRLWPVQQQDQRQSPFNAIDRLPNAMFSIARPQRKNKLLQARARMFKTARIRLYCGRQELGSGKGHNISNAVGVTTTPDGRQRCLD